MDVVLIPGFIGMMMIKCIVSHNVGGAEGASLVIRIAALEGPVGATCVCAVLSTRGPGLVSMGLMKVVLWW